MQNCPAVAEADAPSPAAEGVDISWDIDITEAAEQTQGADSEGSSAQAGPSELVNGATDQQGAWPESVVRLTKDTSCRIALLDDLHELNAFLLQQMQELAAGEASQNRVAAFAVGSDPGVGAKLICSVVLLMLSAYG